ncbi:MAG TPA: 50S ribosomal protein L24 [Burkholderiaceae bacterium]|jgi:large subunit ribosomal protein L24|nr:50S ribosomal protein L24 [Burkholderiaceae bacterium]
MHIRVDDTVEVIAGEDRGTRARVIKVDANAAKIIVEGVNRVYKHMRRSQKNPQGGRLSKEMPISISNVLLVCSSCGQPSRTGARFRDDGSKERYCKNCQAEVGQIAPPRAAYAKK